MYDDYSGDWDLESQYEDRNGDPDFNTDTYDPAIDADEIAEIVEDERMKYEYPDSDDFYCEICGGDCRFI